MLKTLKIIGLIIIILGVSCQKTQMSTEPNKNTGNSVNILAPGGTKGGEAIVVYGPKVYERLAGPPNEYTDTLYGPPNRTLTFRVENGDSTAAHRLSSVHIYLNDEEIFSPKDFNQNVGIVEKDITLPKDVNELKVRLASNPGGFITFSMILTIESRTFTYTGTGYELPPDTVPVPDEYWKYPKEEDIPWSEFQSIQRYIATPEEVQDYYSSGPPGPTEGTNSINFAYGQKGDVILVHDGWFWAGWHRHAGLFIIHAYIPGVYTYETYPWATIHSHPNTKGVDYRSEGYWHNGYDFCRLMRVITWPRSTTLRSDAVIYAEQHLHYPYNYNWVWKWTQSSFYCSQLDWAGYYWKSPWYCRIDIDATWWDSWVSPDDIYANWRTYTVTYSW